MQYMTMRWFALILLFCLAVAAAGWASVRTLHIDTQQTDRGALPVGAFAESPERQFSMVAALDHGDADCDGDGCQDGHCKHGCACGCDMGTCVSPSGALLGQPWALPLIATTDAIAPFIAQSPAVTRATSPLRPPIA